MNTPPFARQSGNSAFTIIHVEHIGFIAKTCKHNMYTDGFTFFFLIYFIDFFFIFLEIFK